MLILMRRENESFIFDDNIIVTVLKVKGISVSMKAKEIGKPSIIMSGKTGDILKLRDNIEIKILLANGRQARLGIDAPGNVSIHRLEIYDRIQREKKEKGNG